MNTVALPVSGAAPTLSAEVDLVRQAARGETDSLEELFRRHGQVAWRLAQAVAIDDDAAVGAVGQGFARALRGARKRRGGSDIAFRPLLLGAVYRTAIDDARSRAASGTTATPIPAAATASGSRRRRRDDSLLLDAAFRSLPERWRAALWLTEVETISADRVASILGVSGAVATQLVTRGSRGLAGRFAQAHREVPEHLGPALRQVALAMPASLSAAVVSGYKAAASDPALRFAPFAEWLNERAVRPLQVAVGGLLGLGLIGLGLVGEGATVSTTQAPTSPAIHGSPSVAPSSSCFGLACASTGTNLALSGSGAGSGASAGGGGGGLLAAAAAPSGPAAVVSGGTAASSPTGTDTLGSTVPSTGGSSPGGSNGGGGGSTGGGGTNPPTTVLAVPGVAGVTQSGGSYTANVLPSSSGKPAASATIGCSSGVGLSVGGTTIGCSAPATGSTPPRLPSRLQRARLPRFRWSAAWSPVSVSDLLIPRRPA